MHWMFNLPHVIALFVSAGLSLLVAFLVWQRRKINGGTILFWGMIAISEYCLGAAFESAAVEPAMKVLFNQINYIGMVCCPALFFTFIMVYTHRVKHFHLTTNLLLWFIPVITVILAWTNAWHGLVWPGFSQGSKEANILIYHHGPAYWVFVCYLYLVLLTGAVILVREFLRSKRQYRYQIGLMLAGAMIPSFSGLVYLSDINPIPHLDWTPIGFFFNGCIMVWCIFRFNLLSLIPVAREALIEQLQDSVMVVNLQHEIVDFNANARCLFHHNGQDLIGKNIDPMLPAAVHIEKIHESGLPQQFVLHHSSTVWIELRVSSIYHQPNELAGWLLVFSDITRSKHNELELQMVNQQLFQKLEEIRHLQAKLQEESIRDVLTGCYNRRYLEDSLQREMSRARREKYQLGLLLLDIDHFKQFNDSYGHLAGDKMLQNLGELFLQKTRSGDIVCRYGGEEFLIIFPNITTQNLLSRAECLRAEVEVFQLEFNACLLNATISMGIALFPQDGDEKTILGAVDQALYIAKSTGRNQVYAYQSQPPTVS